MLTTQKLVDIVECMRCKDEDRDVNKVHSVIDNAAIVGVVVANPVFQFEIMQLAFDQLDSCSIETWAELLMRDAIPTRTLSRRLSCLSSDKPMILETQEQLIVDSLVFFSKKMDTLRQLSVTVREVQKHKLELQQKVVDEVDALVEIIPMPTDPPVTTWSEEKLVLGRQRARSTGKLIRIIWTDHCRH